MGHSSKLVIVNQAANYLTIGLANAFKNRINTVALITGSVHVQGEELNTDIDVSWINKWHEKPAWKKVCAYSLALARIWILLLTKYRKYEVLFVSVPPMGYLLNLLLPNRFSMVIWDVYPDVLRISGVSEKNAVYRSWEALNRRSFRQAWRLFTISESLADSISKYVDRDKVIVLPIWSSFQENTKVAASENPFIKEHGLGGKYVVQYSGNIGFTHNVEVLIDVAESLLNEKDILFQIIGRGPRQQHIERVVANRGLSNVQLLPFQSDEMFRFSLSAADLGVVVLHESVGKGSVPSKAFNLMCFGVPALYIASTDSELARCAKEYSHARCFPGSDLVEISEFIKKMARDSQLCTMMSAKALEAASNYTRPNADRFVDKYFSV